MAYEKQNFVDGQILEAANLNHMESGIESINSEVETVKSGLETNNSELEAVRGSVNELFTSVSNGKALVASAITDKGVDTANDATFEVMATNIAEIKTGGSDNFPIGDGNTHIWISLAEGRTSPTLGVIVKGTIMVDWGDGSEYDAMTGIGIGSLVYAPHEYGKAGNYVITLIPEVDSTISFYGGSNGTQTLTHNQSNSGAGTAYVSAIRKVELGKCVKQIQSGFAACSALTDIAFSDPDNAYAVGGFEKCVSLQSVQLPDWVNSISSDAFSGCSALTGMVIPKGVTKIQYRTFEKCTGARFYDFSQHTAVPELAATNAFTNISADCEILVSAALADEWKAATNWSNYADQIVVKTDMEV